MPLLRLLCRIVLCALMAHPALHAQGLLGTILGTVTDASGAAVGGAGVKVLNQATNLEVATVTRDTGLYQVSNLPIGMYTVTIAKPGFQTEVHSQILVQAERATTVNGALQVGAVTQTVEVSSTPLLNEVDTTNGYVLESSTIRNTPLGTGSFTQLAVLSPGVNADFLAGTGSNAGLGNQAIWANGQRDSSNSFTVNGVNANNLFNGKSGSQVASSRFTLNTGQGATTAGQVATSTSVYDAIGQGLPTPPVETLEEVRVNTAMYDATQSANSGAHVALITKSGSNALHGETYEYFQNNVFNAAPFFRNANTSIAANLKIPPLHYNRFGATLGGPIVKDKLFFFGAWQSLRDSDLLGGTSITTVPTHLTDDRSAAALAAVAQQDIGVTVDPSKIDPAALKIMNLKVNGQYFIPTPNIADPASAKALGGNVTVSGRPSTSQADMYIGDLDYNWSERERLALKYFYQDSPNTNPYASTALNGFPKTLQAGSQVASLDNTSVLKPNLTIENKVGFIRQRAFATTQQPFAPADAGINLFGLTTFPSISLGLVDSLDPNLSSKSLSFGPSGNFANTGVYQNRWDLSSSANWVVGRHTVYFGANWNYTQLNIINNNTKAASLSFTNFGQFLLGNVLPSSTFYNGASNRYYRANQIGAYVQDNYKIRSNLTVNLGLRWDYEGPLWEKYGNLVNFDTSAYKYDASTDSITNSGLVFASNSQFATPGTSNTTMKNRQWGFGPRLGVVWSPGFAPKLTVRSGFGLYYDRGEVFTYFSPGAGRGFSGPFGVTMQLPFTLPINAATGATLSNPFGTTAPALPGDPAVLAKQLPNQAAMINGAAPYIFGGYDAHNGLPYTTNWSFDLQYQPLNSWLFSLGYVGNHGANQVLPIPFNQPGIATADHPINGQTSSYGFNIVPAESIATYEGGNSDLRVPYLGYSSNSVLYQTIGVSNYNALQAGARKRFSHGLQATVSYTWSHALDVQSNLGLFFNGNNPLEPHNSYATSTFDRTHVFTASYYYELPKLKQTSGVLARLANGWGLNGITALQSGQPYNFYDYSGAVAGLYNSTTINIADPIIGFGPGTTIPQVKLQGTTGVNPQQTLVDTSKIYIPAVQPGTFGVPGCATVNGSQKCDTYESIFSSTGRNTFRGPFQSRFDIALMKHTRVNERFAVDFRADAFNIFNHPDFDVPSNSTSLYSVTRSGNAITGVTVRGPSASFGLIQQTIGSPRILQLSAHLVF
jgi:hypothetical protein